MFLCVGFVLKVKKEKKWGEKYMLGALHKISSRLNLLKILQNTSDEVYIIKFDCDSVGSIERIDKAAKLVCEYAQKGKKVVAVVSALNNINDNYKIRSFSRKDSKQKIDKLIAIGEQTCAKVLKDAVSSMNIRANVLEVEKSEWPIITDSNFGEATIISDITKQKAQEVVKKELGTSQVVIIPGLVGKTKEGKITTTGKGGSDTATFLVASALKAKQVILVSDPKEMVVESENQDEDNNSNSKSMLKLKKIQAY